MLDNVEKCFETNVHTYIHLYILLIQGLSTIFVDQLSACHVFRKVHSVLASKFSAFYHIALLVLEMKRHNLK